MLRGENATGIGIPYQVTPTSTGGSKNVASDAESAPGPGTVGTMDSGAAFPGPSFFHGTKADLKIGDLIQVGHASNFRATPLNHVYMSGTLNAAIWGAELAAGDGAGRIYVVEAVGQVEDDPNLTDKKYPGNPTLSYRTKGPLRVIGEVTSWQGHTAEELARMREGVARAQQRGGGLIED